MSSQALLSRDKKIEDRGLRGLPPFVDVVYGAVFGYGVIEIAKAIHDWVPRQKGNGTPLFLLAVTSLYLLFDYAQARMFTEKHPYGGLTRFTLDILIAIGFTSAYIAAAARSPNFLIALSVILALGAWWVSACKGEYPDRLPHKRFIITAHLIPAVVLLGVWLLGFFPQLQTMWVSWVNSAVAVSYLAYCFVLTLVTWSTDEVERSLLPIIPLYGPCNGAWRLFKRIFNF